MSLFSERIKKNLSRREADDESEHIDARSGVDGLGAGAYESVRRVKCLEENSAMSNIKSNFFWPYKAK